MSKIHDIGIAGAGPAGITAAIQLKRSSFEPILFEKDEIGGLLLNANLVENYPGFANGLPGRELVEHFKKHLDKFNIKIIKKEVIKIIPQNDKFEVVTQNENYQFRKVILATGTTPSRMDVKGERENFRDKIFYELKNLPVLKGNEKFIIIGGGDASFDYALNLANKGIHSKILHRNIKFKCLSLLEKRVRKNFKIEIITGAKIRNFQKYGEKIKTNYVCSNEELSEISDYILIAIGRKPNYQILPDGIQINVGKNNETNIPGLYIIGDMVGVYRQVGIAVGSALITAMAINDNLNNVSK